MKIHSLPQNIFQDVINPEELLQSPEKMAEILNTLTEKIASVMKTNVCSLYLVNPESQTLTLKATHGLNKALIDKLTFEIGVGLTGLAAKLLKPITVSNVTKHDKFLPIPNLGDEEYKSFLAIPLIYAQSLIGVMAVQNLKPTIFKKRDIQLLLSLSVPTVSVIERAKFLGTFDKLSSQKNKSSSSKNQTTYEYLKDHIIRGIPASPGIAFGRLKVIRDFRDEGKRSEENLTQAKHKNLFLEAIKWVKSDVDATIAQAALKFGPEELSIFEAYSLILESKSFQNQIIEKIESGETAIKSVEAVVTKYTDRILKSQDKYIQERAYDIQDLAQKIIDRLMFDDEKILRNRFKVSEDTIFFLSNWSISDFIELDTKFTKGIISDKGGAGSHISILADAANIPSIFGIGKSSEQLKDGDFIIVNGNGGHIIVNPSEEVFEEYKKTILALKNKNSTFEANKNKRVIFTRSENKRAFFPIGANIELLPHVSLSLQAGADEVGLFRTEFPFLTSNRLPTEEEQFQYYKKILQAMKGKEVTFRTLDIGGDKYLPYLDLPKENNPSLGWRSIRFSLERQDLFRIQLRALIRASKFGKMRLMFPMITAIEEVEEVLHILEDVKKELHDEKVQYANTIPVGYMIEVPASVEIADKLARYADFFSIGTNDLIQYGLAVDRTNPLVAHLYNPYHPAILKMIAKTIEAGHSENIKVSICGEAASRVDLAACMVGLGIDSLSMNPSGIPKIKHFLRKIKWNDVENLATTLLRQDTSAQIQNTLNNFFTKNKLENYLNNSVIDF